MMKYKKYVYLFLSVITFLTLNNPVKADINVTTNGSYTFSTKTYSKVGEEIKENVEEKTVKIFKSSDNSTIYQIDSTKLGPGDGSTTFKCEKTGNISEPWLASAIETGKNEGYSDYAIQIAIYCIENNGLYTNDKFYQNMCGTYLSNLQKGEEASTILSSDPSGHALKGLELYAKITKGTLDVVESGFTGVYLNFNCDSTNCYYPAKSTYKNLNEVSGLGIPDNAKITSLTAKRITTGITKELGNPNFVTKLNDGKLSNVSFKVETPFVSSGVVVEVTVGFESNSILTYPVQCAPYGSKVIDTSRILSYNKTKTIYKTFKIYYSNVNLKTDETYNQVLLPNKETILEDNSTLLKDKTTVPAGTASTLSATKSKCGITTIIEGGVNDNGKEYTDYTKIMGKEKKACNGTSYLSYSNQYCDIYCKEDIRIEVPSKVTTPENSKDKTKIFSGRYFTLPDLVIKTKKTCVANVGIDKFLKDMYGYNYTTAEAADAVGGSTYAKMTGGWNGAYVSSNNMKQNFKAVQSDINKLIEEPERCTWENQCTQTATGCRVEYPCDTKTVRDPDCANECTGDCSECDTTVTVYCTAYEDQVRTVELNLPFAIRSYYFEVNNKNYKDWETGRNYDMNGSWVVDYADGIPFESIIYEGLEKLTIYKFEQWTPVGTSGYGYWEPTTKCSGSKCRYKLWKGEFIQEPNTDPNQCNFSGQDACDGWAGDKKLVKEEISEDDVFASCGLGGGKKLGGGGYSSMITHTQNQINYFDKLGKIYYAKMQQAIKDIQACNNFYEDLIGYMVEDPQLEFSYCDQYDVEYKLTGGVNKKITVEFCPEKADAMNDFACNSSNKVTQTANPDKISAGWLEKEIGYYSCGDEYCSGVSRKSANIRLNQSIKAEWSAEYAANATSVFYTDVPSGTVRKTGFQGKSVYLGTGVIPLSITNTGEKVCDYNFNLSGFSERGFEDCFEELSKPFTCYFTITNEILNVKPCPTCKSEYDNGDGIMYFYRPIDVNDVFPNSNYDASAKSLSKYRVLGSNWSTEKGIETQSEIEALGEEIYKEAEYSYTLTPQQMARIRAYNDQQEKRSAGYADFNLTCDDAGLKCKSDFLSGEMDGCKGTKCFTDNFYNNPNLRDVDFTLWNEKEAWK